MPILPGPTAQDDVEYSGSVKRRWHAPGAFAVWLTLVGSAAFVALGSWQIDRAQQKQRLFAAFAGASAQPLVGLDQARRGAGDTQYPHLRVRGRYDQHHAYVLDDQVRDSRPGVMVYAVFEPVDGNPALLVNRGFLERSGTGGQPAIPPAPSGERVLTGLYAPAPGSGLRLGGNPFPHQSTWPKLTTYIDLDQIAADLGRPLDARVLLLDDVSGSGFARAWRPQVFPASRHIGYAFTWFTFAVVAVAIFIGMHWRSEPSPQ